MMRGNERYRSVSEKEEKFNFKFSKSEKWSIFRDSPGRREDK